MSKIPVEYRDTFTEEQLLGLKIALGARKWGKHKFDIRGTFGIRHWRYYYVILGGRERRSLSRKEIELALAAKAILLSVFLSFSTLLGLLVLYLIKSALGIDLIPGFSLGIWDWFSK